ncbi:MAG: cation:proton antiporter, partial [Alphaproteobacteria bacterium]|nr:cation:proton antiporter [Alphaproteobacteria bacterium]
MDSHSAEVGLLGLPLVLLAAAVVSVPLARFARLSAIVAYLIAGIVIGPYGLGLFATPERILTVAELGVVMLLFLIGLELELNRLLAMRRDIFGLGVAQMVLTTVAIAALAFLTGLFDWRGALVAGLALALSATSIALRILEDRGHLQQDYGERAFAILLFQDMSVVPLLALVPLMASSGAAKQLSLADTASSVALIGGAIAALVVAGRYLINPFFRLLAWTGAREIMTAAALLIVLGAALLMQVVGMSMALGAFLAGVLLAESSYRHELEADIEPFRGLLLALFFMGVGITIDMKIVLANLGLILGAAIVITLLKALIVWVLFRVTCTRRGDALRAGSVLTGASEFAFVLLPLSVALGIVSATQGSLLSAIAAITLLIGPLFANLSDVVLRRFARTAERDADDFSDAHGAVLLIGFGRFGQIVSQYLLAENLDVTAIDVDPDMIQVAGRFGFKVYYGDGTRLDVLRAAGADGARLVA